MTHFYLTTTRQHQHIVKLHQGLLMSGTNQQFNVSESMKTGYCGGHAEHSLPTCYCVALSMSEQYKAERLSMR